MQQQPKPRWPLIAVSALFVVVAAIGVYAFLWDRDKNPSIIVREDPVADLLGWIPATDTTRLHFAVWTPDETVTSSGSVVPVEKMHGEDLALSPSPDGIDYRRNWQNIHGYSVAQVDAWVTAGVTTAIDAPAGVSEYYEVLSGNFNRYQIEETLRANGYQRSDYRGALMFVIREDGPVMVGDVLYGTDVVALLGNRIVATKSRALAEAVIDTAVGKKPSLADDGRVQAILRTAAPANALMVTDAINIDADCFPNIAEDYSSARGRRFVAVAFGRLGKGGQPRTLVATSFESEEEAASAAAAYELGWQDGYVLAGNSGAPIANFATVSNVSQTENLLIAELIDGREDGWTRAAIRFAQPVCEAVIESLPDAIAATPEIDEPSALNRALTSLPDPGLEGETLAVDLATASRVVGEFAPEDQNIQADEIEAWLAALGPIPSIESFPNDGTKLARWPETLGISLASISAISEIHGSGNEETAAVLVGTWDPEVVGDHLSRLGFPRTNWGEASIYTFTGNLEDPSHELNRAAGATWSNVGIYGDRIFVSPSSSRLREVLDIARGEQSAPDPPDGVYLRDRILTGNTDVTMLEIAGRKFMNDLCIELGDTGVAPEWYGAAAIWKSSSSGGTGEMLIVPGDDQSIADAQQTFDRQITRNRTLISADSEPSGGPFGEMFGYQEIRQDTLADGTAVLVATFSPPAGESPARFFVESVEGCRFGSP